MPRLRAQKVAIDIPRSQSEPWIAVTVQKIDGSHVIDRFDETHRQLSKVASEMITITDPVTGQPVTISVAGMAAAVKAGVYAWMIEDHGGEMIDGEIRVD